MSKKVLILAHSGNHEATRIAEAIEAISPQSHFRLDTDRLACDYRVELRPSTGFFRLQHVPSGETVEVQELASIWYDKTSGIQAPEEVEDDYLKGYISQEYFTLIQSICCFAEMQGVPVLPNAHRWSIAGNKVLQQYYAQQAGFSIPQQLLTNYIPSFLEESWSKNSIYKPSSHTTLFQGDQSFYSNPVRISPEIYQALANDEAETYLHLFQEFIEHSVEYRVFCFGNTVMPFKIIGEYDFDWRQKINEMAFEYDEAFAYAEACLHFMKASDTAIISFDFIQRGNELFYIECNSPGYFLFLDPEEKHGMAERLAQYLLHP